MAEDKPTIPCQYCGKQASMMPSLQMCKPCWEMRGWIWAEPMIALKMLLDVLTERLGRQPNIKRLFHIQDEESK